MKPTIKILIVTILTLLPTHRLPAPIAEEKTSPPPVAEKPREPRPKKKPAEPSESSSARRFDGTWRFTGSSKNQVGSTFNKTMTLVIRNGNSAEFISESTSTTAAGQPWTDFPAPYNSIPTIYEKFTKKSTDLKLEGSNLKIRWPGAKLTDWAPKTIPFNVFKNSVGPPETILYVLSGQQLIVTNGQWSATYNRVR